VEEHAVINRQKAIKQIQEKVLFAELFFKNTIYPYLIPPKNIIENWKTFHNRHTSLTSQIDTYRIFNFILCLQGFR
jgi:hypothetical protein